MSAETTYMPRPTVLRLSRSLYGGGLVWWLVALAAVAAVAAITMASIQWGCAFALLAVTIGLYAYDRTAGLFCVWVVWFVAPMLRRLLFIEQEISSSDPLALVPFAATALVVGVEAARVTLSPRARRIVLFAVIGFALGLPFGLRLSPQAAGFALFAYWTAVGCFVVGYSEGGSGRRPSVVTALLLLTPLMALYAYRQYFLPLPEWDQVWLEESGINSAGSDDQDRVRVWGTLNSPGTNATVLGFACVAYLATMRLNPLRLAGALAVFGALALTYVRSAWIGVVFAILVMVAASRGTALKRVVPVLIVLAALAPVVFSGSTGTALTDRADTFGSLGSDESAQARTSTPKVVIPVAITYPLGVGLGSAGEASQLSSTGGFRATDNTIISLIYQVGPFGLALVVGAIVMASASAWRNAWRRPRGPDVMILGALAFSVCTMLAGDQLYGVGGMIFWFMAGLAVRRGEPMET